ncbi:hypothetical protein BXZ70DRAFT_709032 [Cristinia sonorae]|uniref:F-box domain-containing protein n=1 Tax=Cristinia sonorae TaxID=1940300 RepID=A0A8K0UDW8_9AGAR|nr:hypothetical protein BXZ70DRAFT_709032 [Cristinia sonorae]
MGNLANEAITSTTIRLPLELTDKVIDCLHDNPSALRTCSLISRAFLRRSRFHRFRSVMLNARASEKFEKLLNESPGVGPYVRELHVSVSTFERTPTWVDSRLPHIASKLPNVTTLHMRGNGEYRAAAVADLTSVRELYLTHCEMYSMNEFVSIVGSFPHLQSVCLRDVLVGRSQALTPLAPKLKKSPKVLEFSSSRLDGPMFVDWLLAHDLWEVESLIMVPIQRIAIECVGRFLRVASHSVKYMKIAMVALKSDTTFASEVRSNFGLSALKNLETLEFCSPALYATQYGADDIAFHWVIQMLEDVSSPLKHLAFSLWTGDQSAVTGEDWERITDLLKLPKFSSLRKITFHVWGRPGPTTIITETIRSKLAELDEKGILSFDNVPDPEY